MGQRSQSSIVPILAAVLLAGCAATRLKMYAGPDLAATETALITGEWRSSLFKKPFHVMLLAVDEIPIAENRLHQTEAIVAPGISYS